MIKDIRKKLKEAGIKATVRYLGVGICEYSCHYAIKFPPIPGSGIDYWEEEVEVIDDYDAETYIEDYLYDILESKQDQ